MRYGVLFIALLLCSPPFLQVTLGASPWVEQEQLKAVYLYNFLQFVTWPTDSKAPDLSKTVTIGVVGDSPMNQALEDLASNLKKTAKSSIRIVHYGKYEDGMDLKACKVLFVSASEKHCSKKIIESLNDAPVLTVGDTDAFLSAGGMITMFERQERIRYHVNRKAAAAADLRLSSQLLKTAVSIKGE